MSNTSSGSQGTWRNLAPSPSTKLVSRSNARSRRRAGQALTLWKDADRGSVCSKEAKGGIREIAAGGCRTRKQGWAVVQLEIHRARVDKPDLKCADAPTICSDLVTLKLSEKS